MKEHYIYVWIFLLVSCHSLKNQQNKPLNRTENSFSDSLINAPKDTSFWVFFENFMWDKQFQQSRILFPIEQNGKRIQKPEEWAYLPFYTNHEYIPALASDTLNAFEKRIENDSIQLSIASVQKRVASNYAFEKKEAKWFLTKITQSPLTALPDSAFIAFLIAFSQDTSFQLQHIAFPLSEYYLDSEDNMEKKIRILIVEDEYINLELLQTYLEEMGYEISGDAMNPREAIDVLERLDTDLAILDINLKSEQDGIWIAKEIRPNYHIPFIFLTAYSDKQTIQRAAEVNPYGYLVKPFSKADILASIEIALKNYEKEQKTELAIEVINDGKELTIEDYIFEAV